MNNQRINTSPLNSSASSSYKSNKKLSLNRAKHNKSSLSKRYDDANSQKLTARRASVADNNSFNFNSDNDAYNCDYAYNEIQTLGK